MCPLSHSQAHKAMVSTQLGNSFLIQETMLATLQRLGVMPSFSRPKVSDDNAFSESLFRTLKYIPFYPQKPFASIEDARIWVHQFVAWYNQVHRHSGLKFVTPEQRHRGEDGPILERRKVLYETAKAKNPARWSRSTRDWTPPAEVWLNPHKSTHPPTANQSQVA